ncbi:MAG: cation:proton antiporter [Corynebacterium sp.]|nr:cation:proton antiporter [Corynebacterium sp.]
MVVAVLAPVVSYATGKRIPAVVLLIIGGLIIGENVLGLADTGGGVDLLKELGLGMLFLLAGYEIEPSMLKSREGRSAASTWITCALLCFVAAFFILGGDRTLTAIVLALAVTSTAVGTLLPIIKQEGLLEKPVGRSILIHGAVGEIGPIMAMALLLTARETWMTALVLGAFFAIAILVALLPRTVRFLMPWMTRALIDGAGSTNQTLLRCVFLMLGILMAIAALFELDIVLGAFAAGFILRQVVPERFHDDMEKRLDILGYALLIPVFFVVSGMSIDPQAVIDNPWSLIGLVVLIYCTRGLLIFLREHFRDTGSQLTTTRETLQLSFYAATGLPIIVAVTDVATSANLLSTTTASLLVAAGSCTVLLFPLIGRLIGNTIDDKDIADLGDAEEVEKPQQESITEVDPEEIAPSGDSAKAAD